MLQIQAAFFRQRHASRGALDEARAHMGLQLGDVLADRGRRQAQAAARLGKAAALRDAMKDLQGGQSVHVILLCW
ncbi:hypothetical protein SDC9_195958 [bioreactor metagenome]|uniref:Uncharacterized protein n=1 Tax=bioreactor metagenome TaxID=1076179 RepID=A0A645IAI2_9ZZZZ